MLFINLKDDDFKLVNWARHEYESAAGETLNAFKQLLTKKGLNSRYRSISPELQKTSRKLGKEFLIHLIRKARLSGELTEQGIIDEIKEFYKGNEWIYQAWNLDETKSFTQIKDSDLGKELSSLKEKLNFIGEGHSLADFMAKFYPTANERFVVNNIEKKQSRIYWLLHSLHNIDSESEFIENLMKKEYIQFDFIELMQFLGLREGFNYWE